MTAQDKPAALAVLLVDLSAIFRSCWHASANEPMSVAFEGTLTGVRRAMATLPGAHVAICCDGKGNWRKALSPEYKAHREKQPESMYGELDRVKARLRKDGMLLWECDGFEADDIIGTATQAAFAIPDCHVRIATSDKDLLQLLEYDYVSCLSTRTWEVVDLAAVKTKFGVDAPGQIGDWLALVGDASDNIKGAPGVGPVKAAALLKEFNTLAGIRHALNTQYANTSTPAIRKSLDENWDAVELARKLVELRTDAPINFREVFEVRETQRLQPEETGDMDEPEAEFDDGPKLEREAPKPPGDVAGQERKEEAPQVGALLGAGPQVTALAVQQPYERQLEPTSVGTAYKLAKGLYESRLYQKFANAEAIMAVIIRGRELGIGALASLDCFMVVEGRPYPSAHLVIARAKADPSCEYFQCTETTDRLATWETKNRSNPKPTRLTYTVEQALAVGPLERNGGNWKKRTAEMLRKQAGVALARMEYPEASLGVYAAEEME